jgi:hypothetical protein
MVAYKLTWTPGVSDSQDVIQMVNGAEVAIATALTPAVSEATITFTEGQDVEWFVRSRANGGAFADANYRTFAAIDQTPVPTTVPTPATNLNEFFVGKV